jgi:hypothetical protein
MGVGTKYRLKIGTSIEGVKVTKDMIGRQILFYDASAGTWQFRVISGGIYVDDSGESYIYFDKSLDNAENAAEVLKTTVEDHVYPGEAGLAGRDVYVTLVMGDNAYGTTELSGGGLQHIVKQLGSAGTADPLNQRATVGWKATKAAARLVEAFMVRIETASTFESGQD